MSTTIWIILAGAVLTYLTRAGGYLILSQFDHIHPRVAAGLNAVPAAVLTTLFAPALFNGGPAEIGAMAIAAAVALRFSTMPMFIAGAVSLIVLRHFIG